MSTINLLITLINLIEVICFFTPYCLYEKYYKCSSFNLLNIPTFKLSSTKNINIFSLRNNSLGKFLAIALFCITLLIVIIYLLKLIGKNAKIQKYGWIINIIQMLLIILYIFYVYKIATITSRTSVESSTYQYEYSINWMFYIIIALACISLIFSLLIHFNKLSIPESEPKSSNSSSLDELIQFKELLDSGVITKAEFEEKKKHTLKL